jgi:hypothetical protein
MKPLFVTLLLMSFAYITQAQQKESSDDTTKVNFSNQFESKSISEITYTPLTEGQRTELTKSLSIVDGQIQAIRKKREYILSQPDQKEIAEKEGWFDDMKATEERLIEKRKGLLETLSRQ